MESLKVREVIKMRLSMRELKNTGLLLTGALILSMLFSPIPAHGGGMGGGMGGGGMGGMGGGMPKPPQGTLEVIVFGPSGAPEKDVKVTSIPVTANKGNSKNTNAAGVAKLDKRDYGTYHIVGRKKGYEPAFQEYVAINGEEKSLTLTLTTGEDRTLYFEDKKLDGQASDLVEQGVRALGVKNFISAERLLAEALEIKPSTPDALYYYGVALAEQEKFAQAVESYEKALEMAKFRLSLLPSPRPPGGGFGGMGGGPGGAPGGGTAPKVGAGGAPGGTAPKAPGGGFGGPGGGMGGFGGMNAQQQREREVFENIADLSQQQINLIPALKAQIAYDAGKFAEAIPLYDEAIKADPDNPGLYTYKAWALLQSEQFGKARESINKALELAPGNDLATKIRSAVDELENINKAAASQNEQQAQVERANALITEGDKLLGTDAAAALKRYEEANTLTGGKQPVILRQVGRARARLNQDAEASDAFRKAYELAPANQREDYMLTLVQFYLDTKQYNQAVDAVATGTSNPEQRLMAMFAGSRGNPDASALAKVSLERVIKLNPANTDAALELGQVYYLGGDDGPARDMLTKYVENGKDAGKIQTAKDLLTAINNRNKPKSK